MTITPYSVAKRITSEPKLITLNPLDFLQGGYSMRGIAKAPGNPQAVGNLRGPGGN
jgi:hypothetical protein